MWKKLKDNKNKTAPKEKKPDSKFTSQRHVVTDTTPTVPEVPDLVTLQQNAHVQAQVQQRLQELSQIASAGVDPKIKSQTGVVDIFVKNMFVGLINMCSQV